MKEFTKLTLKLLLCVILILGTGICMSLQASDLRTPQNKFQEEEIEIQGRVMDSDGSPLIGVNILVKGTNKGTSTDFEGKFTLSGVGEDAVLVISYVGYKTQEVAVSGKSNLSITLVSDSQLLDEVVVIGFGTQKKVNLTGSVSTVSSKELKNIPVRNAVQALQGQVPGLLYQYDSKICYPNSSPNTSDAPEGYKTGAFPLGDTWAPENSPCPPGWRIPTAEEIELLIGNNENKRFAWVTPEQSGFAIPGAVVGIPASEAALASKENMRGGIFLPQSGYRNRDDGKQTVWWPANITSITRPGQNWDRVTFWIDGNNNMGRVDYSGNAAAYPIRAVADKSK